MALLDSLQQLLSISVRALGTILKPPSSDGDRAWWRREVALRPSLFRTSGGGTPLLTPIDGSITHRTLSQVLFSREKVPGRRAFARAH